MGWGDGACGAAGAAGPAVTGEQAAEETWLLRPKGWRRSWEGLILNQGPGGGEMKPHSEADIPPVPRRPLALAVVLPFCLALWVCGPGQGTRHGPFWVSNPGTGGGVSVGTIWAHSISCSAFSPEKDSSKEAEPMEEAEPEVSQAGQGVVGSRALGLVLCAVVPRCRPLKCFV